MWLNLNFLLRKLYYVLKKNFFVCSRDCFEVLRYYVCYLRAGENFVVKVNADSSV